MAYKGHAANIKETTQIKKKPRKQKQKPRKQKRKHANKKENTQIKKKPRKQKRKHANKKKPRKQKRKQGTHAKSHSSSQSPCGFLVLCYVERHCVEFPAISLLVSEVASVAFDGELEGGCSAHAVGQN